MSEYSASIQKVMVAGLARAVSVSNNILLQRQHFVKTHKRITDNMQFVNNNNNNNFYDIYHDTSLCTIRFLLYLELR